MQCSYMVFLPKDNEKLLAVLDEITDSVDEQAESILYCRGRIDIISQYQTL